MNLIIDVGNSFVKLAVFQSDICIHKEQVELSNLLLAVENLKSRYPLIKRAILATVNTLTANDHEILASRFEVLELDWRTKLPFKNHYKTPETLGVDRLALISAAVHQYPESNALIIDAGTCVTFDFKDSENNYLGGAISPGLRMRYQAMHQLTAKLPMLESEVPEHFIGNSTTQAMHSGVVNGLVNEIDGVINQ